MKNTIKLFVVIALVAVIGFSFTACDNGSSSGSSSGNVTLKVVNNGYSAPITRVLVQGNMDDSIVLLDKSDLNITTSQEFSFPTIGNDWNIVQVKIYATGLGGSGSTTKANIRINPGDSITFTLDSEGVTTLEQ